MQQSYFENYQDKVTTAVERSASDVERLLQTLRSLIDQAEQQLAESKESDFSLIACRAGCASCCVVNVSILFPEGMAISRYVQALPPGQRSYIISRLDDLWRSVRGLDDDERVALRKPCAFLDQTGFCQIYPVRPFLCRGVTSTSAEGCRQALADTLLDESRPVLMNLFQQQLFEALYLGVGNGLDRAGLEGRGVKLTGLVRYLLKNPEAGAEFVTGKKFDWHEMA